MSTAINTLANRFTPPVKVMGAEFVLDQARPSTRGPLYMHTASVALQRVPHTNHTHGDRARTHANTATLIQVKAIPITPHFWTA